MSRIFKSLAPLTMLAAPSVCKLHLEKPRVSHYVPPTWSLDGRTFTLIGAGVRAVTLLNIQVYIAGIYIDSRHTGIAAEILRRFDTKTAFLDTKLCAEAVEELSKRGIDVCIRISPFRNTDYAHLSSGFVRAITKSDPELQNSPNIAAFQKLFGKNTRLKSGQELCLLLTKEGIELYHDQQKVSSIAQDGLIYRGLLMGYLCGRKLVSEPLRDDFYEWLERY